MIRKGPVFHLKRSAEQITQRLLNRRRGDEHPQGQTNLGSKRLRDTPASWGTFPPRFPSLLFKLPFVLFVTESKLRIGQLYG
jgi:hypothetical protein